MKHRWSLSEISCLSEYTRLYPRGYVSVGIGVPMDNFSRDVSVSFKLYRKVKHHKIQVKFEKGGHLQRKNRKDQESIHSGTTPDPGYHMGK